MMDCKKSTTKEIIINYFFMLGYVWKISKAYVFLSIVQNSVLPTLVEIFNILIFKFIYDSIQNSENLLLVIVSIIAITVVQLSSSLMGEYNNKIMKPKIKLLLSKRFNDEIMDKATRLDLSCYDNNSFYNEFTKALIETDNRALAAMENATNLLRNFLIVTSVIGIIIALDPLMIFFVITSVLIRIFVFPKQNKIIYEYEQKKVPVDRKVKFLKNVFYSPKYAMDLRTMVSLVDIFKNMFTESTKQSLDMTKEVGKKTYILTALIAIVENVFIILLPYLYLCILTFMGCITIGGLTALYSSMQTSAYALADLYANLNSIANANMYIKNLRVVLNMKPNIDNDTEGYMCNEIHEICFNNVSFSYDKEKEVINNCSFNINAGEKIALVGDNGAGKTTIIKLLLRLYDIKSGQITINGINIKEYNVKSLRRAIYSMNQNFSVYPIPIINNILMHDNISDKDIDEVIRLMKNNNIYKEIDDLPNGLFTYVTKEFDEHGVAFSGGELQKIALLRVFFSNDSSVIVLDEPSSALDPISEDNFYKQLMPMLKNKVAIFITHRLASLSLVDRIIFIQEGKIIDVGTLDELLSNNSRFKEYYNSQAKYYVKEDL